MGFRDRISAQKTAEISLPDNMLERLDKSMPAPEQRSVEPAQVPDVESNARETVIKMLTHAPKLDQEFTFKTNKYGGEAHVQAMRTALSRARGDARRKRLPLVEFKLLLVALEHLPTHDLVTVVRSNRSSAKQKGTYDEIIAQLGKTDGEK